MRTLDTRRFASWLILASVTLAGCSTVDTTPQIPPPGFACVQEWVLDHWNVECDSDATRAPDAVTLVGFHEPSDPAYTVDLYGIYSGFAKARLGINGERRSITVGALPDGLATDANYEILDLALDEWNRAAGWQIFVPDFDNPNTDVTWHINDNRLPTYGAWTEWVQFDTGWYRGCHIFTHSWGPPLASTYAHELGHCLGFADVQTDTGYYGTMSYARRGDTWPNNPQDIASLEAAGYRGEP